MDTTVIDQLRSDIETDLNQLEALARSDEFDPAGDEARALEERAAAKKKRLDVLVRAANERTQLAGIDSAIDRTISRKRDEDTRRSVGDPVDVFLRSRAFQEYKGHGRSSTVETGMLQRALSLPITLADFPTALKGIVDLEVLARPTIQTPLLDLIPNRVTSGNHYYGFALERTADGGAAVVAEGDAKPGLDVSENLVEKAMPLVAVHTIVTRQVLEDIPGIRSALDELLREDVVREYEKLAHDTFTAATLPTAQAPASGGTLYGAIRLGVATVQEAGWNPNAVLINPADYAAADIAMLDKAGACCSNAYWGLQVVPDKQVAAGSAIVGDFTNGAVTWEKQAGVNIFITDSHGELFLRNEFVILAEARRVTVVRRPSAFAKVSVAST